MSINSQEDTLQLVTFKLDQEEFGVEILKVHEIIRMMEITKIPNSPDFVKGVINLRGKIIPIVSLRQKFGIRLDDEESNNLRIVVIELNSIVVGFMVDSVSEVLKIEKNIIEPPPEVLSGVDSTYITGVAKLEDRLLILLDLEKLLTSKEKDIIKKTGD